MNPASVRAEILGHVKSSQQDRFFLATASVGVNGRTEHFISVSGNSWKGNAPDKVTINGRTYTVVRNDSGSVPSATNGNQTNFNHAEQKLFSHIKDNYSGQSAKVNIAVQNTFREVPDMFSGCSVTAPDFSTQSPEFNINIYHGSTMENP